MANPVALPGTNVPAGAAVSPGGAQGVTGATGAAGANSATTNTIAFTVPAVGNTVGITVADASWMMVNEFVYVNNAGGAGVAGLLQITAIAGNNVTLLNPAAAPAIPLADSTQSGLLRQVSGSTGDFVDGTNNSRNLVTAVTPTITAVRLRSISSLGNPNFEVDQKNASTLIANSNTWACDRWALWKSGTMTWNTQQQAIDVYVPNTNFIISRNGLLIQLSGQQASLGSSDNTVLEQVVEGPLWRELKGDVHSLALLVNSAVAPLKFSVAIRDNPGTKSIVHLFTIPTANTWTLLTWSNIPAFPSANFSSAPGAVGYVLDICLAAGSSKIAPAADVWQNAVYIGASGMDNLAAQAVNTNFYCGFIQHCPGSNTDLIDLPFGQNLDGPFGCTRYYQKTFDYGTKAGTVTYNGAIAAVVVAGANLVCPISYKKIMAKAPTINAYSGATGAVGNVRDVSAAVDRAASSLYTPAGDSGFSGWSLGSTNAAATYYSFHYTADTGW